MRNYGSIAPIDVFADGGAQSVSLTPAATVQLAEFTVQAPRGGVDGNWPLAMNIVKRISIVIDQPAAAGTAIFADQLPIMFDSFNVDSPLLGTTHPRDTFKGVIAKNIAEYFSAGYTYAKGGRVQVPAADGDNTVVYYQLLPFAHEGFEKPHHFAPWIGWLNGTKIRTYLAPSTAIAAYSTGAVTETPCTVACWIEQVISSELIMPLINQWHLYEIPATGGTTAILQGIGTNNGLADARDGSRLAALLELTNVVGMGGATTADAITSVTIPQLGQDITQNPDAFFSAFWRAQGGHRGPISMEDFGGATGNALADTSGDPYSFPASADSAMNTNRAKYTPWRFTGRNSQLTKILRFFGDLKITRTFTVTPSSGVHRFVTNELRELGEGKKAELIGKTGKAGRLEPLFSTGMPDPNDVNRHPGKTRCMPQRVVF